MFFEVSDVFACKKGMVKQMKIVKIIGELSTTKILHICRHIVNRPFRPEFPRATVSKRGYVQAIDRECFLILLQMKLIFT